jgi:hypothetical protein
MNLGSSLDEANRVAATEDPPATLACMIHTIIVCENRPILLESLINRVSMSRYGPLVVHQIEGDLNADNQRRVDEIGNHSTCFSSSLRIRIKKRLCWVSRVGRRPCCLPSPGQHPGNIVTRTKPFGPTGQPFFPIQGKLLGRWPEKPPSFYPPGHRPGLGK